METSKLILALLFCSCLAACQWDLEEIELANALATCIQNCVNGTCNSNNICECQTGWQGANCDTPITNTNTNFCDTTNCNNGACNEALNKCDCADGWMGEDCLTEIENQFTTFEKTISNGQDNLRGLAILLTSDEHYIIVGSRINLKSNVEHIYVVKLDLNGEIVWRLPTEMRLGWRTKIDLLEINNEYYIGAGDIIFKISNEGSLVFLRTFDKGIISLKKQSQSSILLIGSTGTNFTMPSSKIWIAILDINSELSFEKTYGGSDDDIGIDRIILNDGYLITGSSYSNDFDIPSNYGENDVLLIKTDLAGNLLWSKNYGGSSTDSPYSLARTNDNGCILVCNSSSKDFDLNNKNSNTWVFRVDKTGDMLWQKKYGDPFSRILVSKQLDNQNNFLLAGTINNGLQDFWLVKIDPFGNIIWEKTYDTNGDEVLSDMQVTPDGGFIMVGTKDNKDIYIVKTDANGNL